jgi:hypothetical protein
MMEEKTQMDTVKIANEMPMIAGQKAGLKFLIFQEPDLIQRKNPTQTNTNQTLNTKEKTQNLQAIILITVINIIITIKKTEIQNTIKAEELDGIPETKADQKAITLKKSITKKTKNLLKTNAIILITRKLMIILIILLLIIKANPTINHEAAVI